MYKQLTMCLQSGNREELDTNVINKINLKQFSKNEMDTGHSGITYSSLNKILCTYINILAEI